MHLDCHWKMVLSGRQAEHVHFRKSRQQVPSSCVGKLAGLANNGDHDNNDEVPPLSWI